MTNADNITAAEQLGVDIIGMVFYPKSPRYVKMIRSRAGIIPDYSQERMAAGIQGIGKRYAIGFNAFAL